MLLKSLQACKVIFQVYLIVTLCYAFKILLRKDFNKPRLLKSLRSRILKAYCEKKSAAVKIEDFKSSQAAHIARAAFIFLFKVRFCQKGHQLPCKLLKSKILKACLCEAQDQGLRPCMVTLRVTIMVTLRVTIKREALACAFKIFDFNSMHAPLLDARYSIFETPTE